MLARCIEGNRIKSIDNNVGSIRKFDKVYLLKLIINKFWKNFIS